MVGVFLCLLHTLRMANVYEIVLHQNRFLQSVLRNMTRARLTIGLDSCARLHLDLFLFTCCFLELA
jgi:hypothetical protein